MPQLNRSMNQLMWSAGGLSHWLDIYCRDFIVGCLQDSKRCATAGFVKFYLLLAWLAFSRFTG